VELSRAIVGLADSPCQQGQLCGGSICRHTMTRGGKEDFNCGGVAGTYLYVQLSGATSLSISEVEVFSATSTDQEFVTPPHPTHAPLFPPLLPDSLTTSAPSSPSPSPSPSPPSQSDASPDPTINLALGKPARQSSVGHHRYTAEKAVDGGFDWK